jgi:hypothetical protein
MGCDIHIRAEINGNQGWEPVGDVFDSDYNFHFTDANRDELDRLPDHELLSATNEKLLLPPQLKEKVDAFAIKLKELQESTPRLSGDEQTIRQREQKSEALQSVGGIDANERETLTLAMINFRYSPLAELAEEDYMDDPVDFYNSSENRLSIYLHRTSEEPPFKTASPWEGRNYRLFAILADVRNGSGFAGVDTGDRIEPISDPRGVPSDAHPETRDFLESYGVDGHSHSWFTLAELEDYDWGKGTVERGIVNAGEYEELLNEGGGEPTAWSGGVSGSSCVTFDADAYLAWRALGAEGLSGERVNINTVFSPHLRNADEDKKKIFAEAKELYQKAVKDFDSAARLDADHLLLPYQAAKPQVTSSTSMFGGKEIRINQITPYVRYQWLSTKMDEAGPSWQKTMDSLAQMAPDGDKERIRICFFFDN